MHTQTLTQVFLDKNTDDASVEQQRCKLADFGLSLLFSKASSNADGEKKVSVPRVCEGL